MSFQKFGDKEKITKVLDEPEVNVIQSHIAKVGKPVQEFSDEERESLREDLDQSNQ